MDKRLFTFYKKAFRNLTDEQKAPIRAQITAYGENKILLNTQIRSFGEDLKSDIAKTQLRRFRLEAKMLKTDLCGQITEIHKDLSTRPLSRDSISEFVETRHSCILERDTYSRLHQAYVDKHASMVNNIIELDKVMASQENTIDHIDSIINSGLFN